MATVKEKKESPAFDCLAVTQVLVFPFKDSPLATVKAIATVVLNDQFMVRGLRVMNGCNGLFVSYPVDPFYKGDDLGCLVQPITRKLREHIESCVLEKYRASIA